jgi:DNA repair protein RecN (Recombination protein N)
MLKSLFISNYALISRLDIDFESGFSAVTGETGAGKSIIMGALGLILGQRADNKSIREDEDKCIVEALFDLSNYKHLRSFFDNNELDFDGVNCLVRRELSGSGKSRAFINDTPVALNILKDLTTDLIDIHSQHENLLLSHVSYQLEVLDTVAHNQTELQTYKDSYHLWKSKSKALSDLQREAQRIAAESDFIRFQFNQLEEAKLTDNELIELEVEHETLTHAEEIKLELSRAQQLLNGDEASLIMLKDAIGSISKIHKYIPDGESSYERIQSAYIELKELGNEFENLQEKMEFNPARLEWVETRMSELYALMKKFKVADIAALIAKKEEYGRLMLNIETIDDQVAGMQKELDQAYVQLMNDAAELTKSRNAQIHVVEDYLCSQLKELGMPNIQFEIQLTESASFQENGRDDVRFYFSANKNRPMQPVETIASGGEISRVMLAIKSLIADKSDLPTIIFDEIDTGVSGEIAHRMGEIMLEMSKSMQVITITHLPQIAARGNCQYKVFKDDSGARTETYITRLNEKERVEEIASMLSGREKSEAAIRNAEALLAK